MSVLGWCFLAAGFAVLWLLIVFARLMNRTDALSAGSAQQGTRKPRVLVAPEAADSTPGVVSRDATPGVDPINICIDTAAALLAQDKDLERHEVEFARDVSCWLAVGAPENWSPPPVVPGRSEP